MEACLHDVSAEQSTATFHLRGACGPSLSEMFADQNGQPSTESTWHGPYCGQVQSTLSFVDVCLMMTAMSVGRTHLTSLLLLTLVAGCVTRPALPFFFVSCALVSLSLPVTGEKRPED